MTDEEDETQRGFLRQRRNLFLVSLVLVTIQLTGATVSDKFTLLGVEITLKSPEVVFYVLVALWLYWAYRYYVYHRDVMPVGFRDAIETRRIVELKKLARLQAAWEIEGERKSDEDEKLPPGKFRFREAAESSDLEYGETTCEKLPGDGGYTLKPSLEMFFTSKAKGADYKSLRSGPDTREYTWTQSSPQVRKASWRARRWVLFNTHYATEYGVPYLVASAPPVIGAVQLLARWFP